MTHVQLAGIFVCVGGGFFSDFDVTETLLLGFFSALDCNRLFKHTQKGELDNDP